VCPLEERELHIHDSSCYAVDRTLICDLEEDSEHTHTDECYQETRSIICGQEEVNESHVHGPGCFVTITVASDDDEAASEDGTEAGNEAGTEAETVDMPEQTMVRDLTETDENGVEHVVLTVRVDAPEGAFPAGTTMKVRPIMADEVTDSIEKTVSEQAHGKVTQVQAVDISFYDANGTEIEPAENIDVRLTSDFIASSEDPKVVHVDDDGNADIVSTLDDEEYPNKSRESDALVFRIDAI
jgi:hypothetical protein